MYAPPSAAAAAAQLVAAPKAAPLERHAGRDTPRLRAAAWLCTAAAAAAVAAAAAAVAATATATATVAITFLRGSAFAANGSASLGSSRRAWVHPSHTQSHRARAPTARCAPRVCLQPRPRPYSRAAALAGARAPQPRLHRCNHNRDLAHAAGHDAAGVATGAARLPGAQSPFVTALPHWPLVLCHSCATSASTAHGLVAAAARSAQAIRGTQAAAPASMRARARQGRKSFGQYGPHLHTLTCSP
eukprot:366099-Chlamydomonas_euryale.AAC.6